jgi:hypothetical protein
MAGLRRGRPASAPEGDSARYRTLFHCIGGRGEIDAIHAMASEHSLQWLEG